MDVAKVFLIDVGVDLGRRDVGVAEQLLNNTEIGPVAEEVGRKGVAQEVRVDVGLDPGEFCPLFHDLPDPRCGEFFAPLGEKDLAATVATHEHGALSGEVLLDGFAGSRSDGDDTGFVAFAGDADGAILEKEIFEAGSGQFGDAQTARIHEFEHGPVASRKRQVVVDGLEEPLHGGLVEGLGEILFETGRIDLVGDIGGDFALRCEMPEEDLDRDELHPQAGGGEPVIEAAMSEESREMREHDPGGFFDPVAGLDPFGEGFE